MKQERKATNFNKSMKIHGRSWREENKGEMVSLHYNVKENYF